MGAPKKTRRAAKVDKKPKALKVNPVDEYRQMMSSTGVIEALTLVDDDCLSTCRRFISTQSVVLDQIMGDHGIPCGRVTELFGAPHAGKSTLLDHMFAQVQRDGGVAILIDTEASRDERYTRRIGVDTRALQYLEFEDQPTIESVLMAIERTVKFWKERSPTIPVVIGWDSLGATPTAHELSLQYGEAKSPGDAARELRKAFRRLPTILGGSNVALVICNHEYQVVGGNRGFGGGTKSETYGGAALRHAASVRIKFWISGYLKGANGVIIGREVVAKIEKNRLGSSPREGTLAIVNGVGVNNVLPLLEWLKGLGRVVQAGSWLTIQGTGDESLDGRKFQGWWQFTEFCQRDAEVYAKLMAAYQRAREPTSMMVSPDPGSVVEELGGDDVEIG